jgi:hypothetical protein
MISTLWLAFLIAGAKRFGCVLIPLDRFEIIAGFYGGTESIDQPIEELEEKQLVYQDIMTAGEDHELAEPSIDPVEILLRDFYGIKVDDIEEGLN